MWQTVNPDGHLCLCERHCISVCANIIFGRFFLSESSDADHGARELTRVHRTGLEGLAMADMPKVITAKVAARFVGLSESTLAKLRLNGNGPIYCKLGRRVVYRPADLEQWLQSRTARDTSDADARFLKALTVAHPR
jgi:predicted DNA-binding transcriptional regulator AlpA